MYDVRHQWGSALPNSLLGEQTLRKIMIAVAVATGFMAVCGRAEAAIVVNIEQVGANVVTTGSGSIDLSVLTEVGDGGTQPLLWGQSGWVFVGPVGGGFIYTGLTGPSSFGTGGLIGTTPPGDGTGDGFGFEASNTGEFVHPVLYLPFGYVSGSTLSGSAIYDNTTIAGLGLTPGTYIYTATGVGNTLTVNIGSVPEPSSITMATTALGLLGGVTFRRRRRKV
jgi:hypothetical protein